MKKSVIKKEWVLDSVTVNEKIQIYKKEYPAKRKAEYDEAQKKGLPCIPVPTYYGDMTIDEFKQMYPMYKIIDTNSNIIVLNISQTFKRIL